MSKQFPYKTNIDRVISDVEGNPISSDNPLPVSIKGDNAREQAGIKVASDYPGNTGGEKIQNAINDLSSRGGLVFIPTNGPDTVGGESGVWEVDKEIESHGKNGVHVMGAGPGWGGSDSGATLRCSKDNLEYMMRLTGGFLDTVTGVRFDGNNKAIVNLQVGHKGGSENDCQIFKVMSQNAKKQGIVLNSHYNVWMDNCWVELNGKQGVFVNDIENSVWINNHLSWNNGFAIHVGGSSDTQKVWIDKLRSDKESMDCISIAGGSHNVWVLNSHINSPRDAIRFHGNLSNIHINNINVYRDANSRHVINNTADSIEDIDINHIQTYGESTEPEFNNIIGYKNGKRVIFNGVGYNNGNPNSEGDWNGHGKEGITVKDEKNKKYYKYIDGSWVELAVN